MVSPGTKDFNILLLKTLIKWSCILSLWVFLSFENLSILQLLQLSWNTSPLLRISAKQQLQLFIEPPEEEKINVLFT